MIASCRRCAPNSVCRGVSASRRVGATTTYSPPPERQAPWAGECRGRVAVQPRTCRLPSKEASASASVARSPSPIVAAPPSADSVRDAAASATVHGSSVSCPCQRGEGRVALVMAAGGAREPSASQRASRACDGGDATGAVDASAGIIEAAPLAAVAKRRQAPRNGRAARRSLLARAVPARAAPPEAPQRTSPPALCEPTRLR